MVSPATDRLKIVLGLMLGLAIGAACRVLGIASPAPPVLSGAALVVAMTVGYSLMDWWPHCRTARHRANCGGPDGSVKRKASNTPGGQKLGD